MYHIQKVHFFNLPEQIKVNHILYDCGKDMAEKYDLHHWDNSYFKNFIIITLCQLKNTVYLVTDNERPVATFQTKQIDKVMRFEKLACSPKFSGKGIGSYCINYIEEMAIKANCEKICMVVYSLSKHALDFYLHRGYKICGETKTLKYVEVSMEKMLK